MTTVQKYKDYLTARLPDEYPISSIPLSLKMTEAHRKVLVFNQSVFLDAADAQLNEMPWISSIAAIKHLKILEIYATDTSTFREFHEKEYFDNVQNKCLSIFNKTDKLLDASTKANCVRIVALQAHFYEIIKTIDVLNNAIRCGIETFEPPMNPPNMLFGFLIATLITALPMVISGQEAVVVGLFLFIVSFLVVCLIYKPKNEKYIIFNKLRESYYSITSNYSSSLSIDTSKLALNLIESIEIFKSLVDELNILTDTYISLYSPARF